MTPKTILKDIFGYDEFRPLQEDIITSILNKNDSLVIMPTGGGKSLCFQVPALIFEGLTVVISPLISLMKDQVRQLTELGVDAVCLNSSLSLEEYRINEELIKNKKVKLLYVAPETLVLEKITNLLSLVIVDCITVDEAHCISEWGHDFRQEYRQISDIRKLFKDAVLTAFTATATPQVQSDIINNLKLERPNNFIASFNRKNLYLQIKQKSNPLFQMISFLDKFPNQSGIIYCFSRRQVDELYEELKERKYSVLPYHAGLSDIERRMHQEDFIKDDVQIIIATIAFGMGINKPNVRFVIHFDLPKNIESYYQEIGRAGRDELRAHCLLLFGYGDIRKINYFIDQKEDKEKRIAKMHLDSLIRYAESYSCRRIPLLNHFGEKYIQQKCGMCDNCEKEDKDIINVTTEAKKILSCIKRTGEYFGVMHVINVLRGSKSKKVKENNHHLLTTHGIGKDISKEQWLNLSHQFIRQNIIKKDFEYGSLKITDLGYEVLKGNQKVDGKIMDEKFEFTLGKESLSDYNKNLFLSLKAKRKNIADKANLPPYIIFSDKTLIEMATYLPKSVSQLERIHGIGKYKIEKYAKHFLPIIIQFCKTNNISETNMTNDKKRKKTTIKRKRFLDIGEAYQKSKSFEELQNLLRLKHATIIKHLTTYVNEGNKINTETLFKMIKTNSEKTNLVFATFDKLGTDYLKPIFEELNGTVPYEDLRMLKVCYINQLDG